MYAPPWRIWLVAFLIIAWGGLAMRFYFVKHEPVLALLCAVMGAMNAFFLWRMNGNRPQ